MPNHHLYQPIQPSRSDFIDIRGLRYHVRIWGSANTPKLFLCHGWMDSSASFQFLIDALQNNWQVIAPDWRGFGLSEKVHSDTYYFPDYFADLEAVINHYVPDTDQPILLVGHSMGGNITAAYAGIRPARVAKLVNIEGFGLPPTQAQNAPEHFAGWLDRLQSGFRLRPYSSFNKLAERLQKKNPNLSEPQAEFLARQWGYATETGDIQLHADPWHKNRNPVQYRLDEMIACWRNITAPVLTVIGKESEYTKWVATEMVQERLMEFPNNQVEYVADAGHMLHFDCPEKLAEILEGFLLA